MTEMIDERITKMAHKGRFIWDYEISYGEHQIPERVSQWNKMSKTEREDEMRREMLSLEKWMREHGGMEVLQYLEFARAFDIYHYAHSTVVISHLNPVKFQPTNFAIGIASNQPLEEVIKSFPEPYNRREEWREHLLLACFGTDLFGIERIGRVNQK